MPTARTRTPAAKKVAAPPVIASDKPAKTTNAALERKANKAWTLEHTDADLRTKAWKIVQKHDQVAVTNPGSKEAARELQRRLQHVGYCAGRDHNWTVRITPAHLFGFPRDESKAKTDVKALPTPRVAKTPSSASKTTRTPAKTTPSSKTAVKAVSEKTPAPKTTTRKATVKATGPKPPKEGSTRDLYLRNEAKREAAAKAAAELAAEPVTDDVPVVDVNADVTAVEVDGVVVAMVEHHESMPEISIEEANAEVAAMVADSLEDRVAEGLASVDVPQVVGSTRVGNRDGDWVVETNTGQVVTRHGADQDEAFAAVALVDAAMKATKA